MSKTLQFRCTLMGSKPPIWRQFLVSEDYRLDRFHQVLQIVTGWTNSHLHEFSFNGRQIGMQMDHIEGMIEVEDETVIYLKDLKLKKGDKFLYLYDFGDDWTHLLELENKSTKSLTQPLCINGERGFPPEDCGGIPGYMNLLETLQKPSDDEYESLNEWLPDYFDSEFFSIDRINLELNKFAAYHRMYPSDKSTPWHQLD